MKRLVLMRHAKSDWAFDRSDRDRPLNKRGRKSVPAVAEWLATRNHHPQEALVSSAERTRETWSLLGSDATVRFLDDLYLAEPEVMLDALFEATADTVLMIGHNPGIAELAHSLVNQTPDHPRFSDYPTCATLVVEFDVAAWSDIRPGTGRVLDFIVPRELT